MSCRISNVNRLMSCEQNKTPNTSEFDKLFCGVDVSTATGNTRGMCQSHRLFWRIQIVAAQQMREETEAGQDAHGSRPMQRVQSAITASTNVQGDNGAATAFDDDVSFMQLLYKVGGGGVIQLKKVDEISMEEMEDGWMVQDEWLEHHEVLQAVRLGSEAAASVSNQPSLQVCSSSGARGSYAEAKASREDADESETEDVEDEDEDDEEEEEEEEEVEYEYLEGGKAILAITEEEWTNGGHKKTLNVVLETAKKWCEGRSIVNIHWVPGDLKVDGRPTKAYHEDCKRHKKRNGQACPYKLRARIARKDEKPDDAQQDDSIRISIEKKYEHEGDSDADCTRKQLVKSITKSMTAKNAEVELTKRGIKHKGKWRKSLENARFGWTKANKEPVKFDAEFQDTMKQFCANPPKGLQCFYDGEGWEISDHVMPILYGLENAVILIWV